MYTDKEKEKRCFNCHQIYLKENMIHCGDILPTYFCSVDCINGKIEKMKFAIKKHEDLINSSDKHSEINEAILKYIELAREDEEYYKLVMWLTELKEYRLIAESNSLLFDKMYR